MMKQVKMFIWIGLVIVSNLGRPLHGGDLGLSKDTARIESVIADSDSFADTAIGAASPQEVISSLSFRVGIGKCHFGPTIGLSLEYSNDNWMLLVRYLSAAEFRFNIEGIYDNPPLEFKEAAILLGRSYRNGPIVLSLSAGLGVIKGVDRGPLLQNRDYARDAISMLGFPFEANFRVDLGAIGIGGSWFGDVNSKRFISGGMFNVYVGPIKL